jgi:hypothetical protein
MIYQRLEKSRREIRLIVIKDDAVRPEDTLTSDSEVELNLSLITTSLEHYRAYPAQTLNTMYNAIDRILIKDEAFTNDFYALSYVWGDPSRTCRIRVNGELVNVGQNLHAALLSIKHNTKFRVIWADALCINQEDTAEKSWQVQQMYDIYCQALGKISWLGPRCASSNLAMGALRNLRTTLQFSDLWHTEKTKERPSPAAHKRVRNVARNISKWKAIIDLSKRPYWTRLWIFQELAAGGSNYCLCGDMMVKDADCVLAVIAACGIEQYGWPSSQLEHSAVDERYTLNPVCTTMVETVRLLRYYKHRGSIVRGPGLPGTFHNLLERMRILSTSEPRDRIYALLCIANDARRIDIIPDYSKSIRQVLIEAACALLKQGDISMLLTALTEAQPPWLPSWCPDWLTKRQTGELPSYLSYEKLKQRKTTLNKIGTYSEILELDAYILGTITTVCSPCPSPNDTQPTTFNRWMEDVDNWARQWHGQLLRGTSKTLDREMVIPTLYSRSYFRHTPARVRACYQAMRSAVDFASFHANLTSVGRDTSRVRRIAETVLPVPGGTTVSDARMQTVLSLHSNVLKGDYLYALDSGMVGCAWKQVEQVGDIVAIIPGVSTLFVLRPLIAAMQPEEEHTPSWKLVGATTVYDAMVRDLHACAKNARFQTIHLS